MYYDTYEDVMKDPNVDVVYIATLADQHAALATESLKYGKPTVVEKPVSLSYEDTNALIETADSEQVFFMYVSLLFFVRVVVFLVFIDGWLIRIWIYFGWLSSRSESVTDLWRVHYFLVAHSFRIFESNPFHVSVLSSTPNAFYQQQYTLC